MATLASVQPSPGSWQAWWLAARPATLSAAVVPVAVGTAIALGEGRARALPALAALCTALLLQVGANFANDVFDFERGADTDRRLGPLRATQGGLLSPAAMRRGMRAVFGVATLLGVYLVTVGGWPIALLGLLALAAAYAYTGGPFPLGYRGLGDPLVFLFFGVFAVTGTHYVQAGSISALALGASIPVACLATAILAVNNLRDLETDREAGKRTLAVRLGPEATQRYVAALLWTPYLVCGALALADVAGLGVLLPWLSAPLASRLERSVAQAQGAELNPCLARTARLELLFGALLALGLLA